MATLEYTPAYTPLGERILNISNIEAGDQINIEALLGRSADGVSFNLTSDSDVIEVRINSLKKLRSNDSVETVNVWSKALSSSVFTFTGSEVIQLPKEIKIYSIEIVSLTLSVGTTISISTIGGTPDTAVSIDFSWVDTIGTLEFTQSGSLTAESPSGFSGWSSTSYATGAFNEGNNSNYMIAVKFHFPATIPTAGSHVIGLGPDGYGITLEWNAGAMRLYETNSGSTQVNGGAVPMAGLSGTDVWAFIKTGDAFTNKGLYIIQDGDRTIRKDTGVFGGASVAEGIEHKIGYNPGDSGWPDAIYEIISYDFQLNEQQMADVADGTFLHYPTHYFPLVNTEPTYDTLYIKYNGGEELHDGSGHLPRDADDYYISRTTGLRLRADQGYVEGDVVGPLKLHGLLSAVVVGTPATGRRSGLDQCSLSDFVALTIDNSEMTAAAQTTMVTNAASDVAFIGADAGTDSRFALFVNDVNGVDARLYDVSLTKNVRAVRTGGFAAGATSISVSSIDSFGVLDIRVYDDAGVFVDSQTSTTSTIVNVDGTYYIGRGRGSGEFANGILDCLIGFDGTAISSTIADNLASDIADGASIDYIRSSYSPQLASDGLVCGAADPSSITELFTIGGGSGANVTVELDAG